MFCYNKIKIEILCILRGVLKFNNEEFKIMLTNEQLKKYVNLFNDDNMCFFEYKKGYFG